MCYQESEVQSCPDIKLSKYSGGIEMIIANMFRWKYTLISISAVFILYIIHFSNIAYSIPVSERTEQVQEQIKRALDIDDVSQITDAHLARITALNLRNKDIHSLKSGDFEGLSGIKNLNLFGNNLDVLPNSIFSGLKSLTVLRLGGNNTDPLQIPIKLEKISDGEFRAVVITAAPFDIELDINIVNGTTKNSKITVNKGSTYSSILNVERIYGTTDIVTAEIKVLPQLPKFHYGYIFVKSNRSPINVIDKVEIIIDKTLDDNVVDEVIEEDEVLDDSLDNQEPEIETSEVQNDITNNPPYFGTNNIFVRYIEENVISGINVGMPITAIDQDPNDTLIYSLDGLDQESFSIDSKSGQILTKLPLDYESKNLYIVRVVVSDYKDKNWVYVVIKLIDKNDGRTNFVEDFLDINERTPAVQDAIISAIPNTDNAENITVDHLESITELNLRGAGITQLKSGDFSGLHGLTNLNLYGNMLRRLPEGIFNGLISLKSLRLGRNIFDPLPILVSFQKIEFDKYQVVIPTGAPFDINMLVNNNTSIDTVRIKKGDTRSNVFTSKGIPKIEQLPTLPRNHFGYTISQSTVCHRSQQVIKGITNSLGQPDCRLISDLDLLLIRDLDLSGMSIESLKSFDFSGLLMLNHIDLSNNKLSKLPEGIFDKLTRIQSLNLHNNRFDPLPITFLLEKVGKDQIKITIPVCAPSEMNIPVSVKVGEIVSNKFIVSISTGNYESDLYTITRPDDTLDYIYVDIVDPIDIPNTHSGYTFIGNTNTPLEIFERINVAPVFVEGEKTNRNIAENTDSGENIGIPITATDRNKDKLNYTITGQDAQSFSIDNSNGQIITKSPLDYETKSEYSIIVNVSDGILTTSIIVAIKIDDVYENIYPVFVEGENTTRNIAENTDIGINAIKATDANENDTLEYTLSGTDASHFKIDSASGQLITNSQLDFETKSSYSIIVHVSDNNGGTDSITVKIIVNDVNEAPVFISDLSTRITIDENITTRTNIGKFTATDEDKDDILKWTITGEEAQYFHIISTTGQLQTKSPLDYETKSIYTFDVNVYDNHGLSDTISVDIEISDIDENTAPEFIEGETVSRYIAENSNAGIDIGSPITARDSEQDSLVYTIQGTDANTFDIISTTGQLKTKDSLDYEFKNSYSVQVIVSDGKLTDTITVTIYINDVFEIVDIEPDIPENTQPDIPETTQPDTSENTQPDIPENTQPDIPENTQPDIPE
ncbi:hypothetical protein F4225_16420, partial [Candidatus Poribacteria bacterium]|nr:hypothetical protein [Candidatus Poribacteria bacterium]